MFEIQKTLMERLCILIYHVNSTKRMLKESLEKLSYEDFPYESLNIYDFQALLFSWGDSFRFGKEALEIIFNLIDIP